MRLPGMAEDKQEDKITKKKASKQAEEERRNAVRKAEILVISTRNDTLVNSSIGQKGCRLIGSDPLTAHAIVPSSCDHSATPWPGGSTLEGKKKERVQ